MKIPTANVVVAFDLTTMERLFSAGATYKSLVAELEKGNANGLLFDNVSNPNFIEFEHDFALNKSQFVLSFIDPNDEFETRFFSENPVRLFQGYSSSSMGLSKSFSTDKPLDVKQSQEDYSKEFIAETKKLLENTYREKEIYVAYGTGNNLDLWSGPHRTTLVGADITVKGAKKVTLKMAAIPSPLDTDQRRGMYNEKLDLDLHGLSMRFAGESQEIKFLENKTYDPTEYIENNRLSEEVQRYQDETSEALANLGFENLSDKLEKFDFHCIVVDALRNYIQKATNNRNVIVLLPNLNVVCRQVISDMARQYSLLQPLGQATEAVAGALFGNFVKSRVSDLFTKSDTILGNEEMFLEGTLKSFGLRLHSGDRQSAETLQKQAIPTGEVAAFALPEKFPSARDAVRKYYEDRYFTAVIDKTDKKIPDHMRIVKDIYNNIKKLSQESYMMSTFASIVETDINLLKLWGNNTGTGRWGKYYTLAGYDDFDPTGNAVIVGDLALIKEYLYGSIDLKTMSDSIKKLKMQSKKTKVKKIKGDGFFAKAANAIAGAPSRSLGFQAATKHPIHPMDRVLLTNHTFNKKVRDITFPRIEDTTGSFGNISYIPDDFAYKDAEFSKEEKKYIEENAIPIFRYNTENPNILDLKIKAGTIYFDMLKSGYQKEIRRLTSAVAEGILPTGTGSFPIRSRGAANTISKK